MRSGKSGRLFRAVGLCIAALLVGGALSRVADVVRAQTNQNPMQTNQDPMGPTTVHHGSMPSDGMPDMMDRESRARMNEDRVKAMNDARHKRLEDDAGRLLSLSTELKTDVDKTNEDELSLDAMRKAAEIEKLAHDVQSHMKN